MQLETSEMSDNIEFVALPPGEASSSERLHHIAVQATAVMLQSWFKDAEPDAEEARDMVNAVMTALLKPRTGEPPAS
jgi:hypothetical protein